MDLDDQDRLKRNLNIYRVTQRYGGPEEGGWYYPVYEPITSYLCMSQEELDEQTPKFVARVEELNEHVSRGAYYSLMTQGHFAEFSPKRQPTYE